MVLKRGESYHLKIKPFGHPIWVRTLARTKQEAREIERAVLTALRTDDYRSLWPESREVVLRIYENQGWRVPDELVRRAQPNDELTLRDATKLFFNYPTIKRSKSKERYTYALAHVLEILGTERPVKSIKVRHVTEYQDSRLEAGASPSTVNWEKATLSKLFQVLVELEHVETNPVREVTNLSRKVEERQADISYEDVQRIAGKCPEWFQAIIWAAYYTGMRRSEILGLTRNRVSLHARMLYLGPQDTKEGYWKRVPIHRDLVPIMTAALKSSFGSDRVFLLTDDNGTRVPTIEAVKNCWPRALEAIDRELKKRAEAGEDVKPWPKPWPRFHDLRAAWRTNARRSGVDPQIAETILGHWFTGKSVNDRYGYVSDDELIQAIDRMTFDHGKTKVLVAKSRLEATESRGSNRVAKPVQKKKGHAGT